MSTFTISPMPTLGGTYSLPDANSASICRLDGTSKFFVMYSQTNPDYIIGQFVNYTGMNTPPTTGTAYSIRTNKFLETRQRVKILDVGNNKLLLIYYYIQEPLRAQFITYNGNDEITNIGDLIDINTNIVNVSTDYFNVEKLTNSSLLVSVIYWRPFNNSISSSLYEINFDSVNETIDLVPNDTTHIEETRMVSFDNTDDIYVEIQGDDTHRQAHYTFGNSSPTIFFNRNFNAGSQYVGYYPINSTTLFKIQNNSRTLTIAKPGPNINDTIRETITVSQENISNPNIVIKFDENYYMLINFRKGGVDGSHYAKILRFLSDSLASISPSTDTVDGVLLDFGSYQNDLNLNNFFNTSNGKSYYMMDDYTAILFFVAQNQIHYKVIHQAPV